ASVWSGKTPGESRTTSNPRSPWRTSRTTRRRGFCSTRPRKSRRTWRWRRCIKPRPRRRGARTITEPALAGPSAQQQGVQVPVVLGQDVPRHGRGLRSLVEVENAGRWRQRIRGRNRIGIVAVFAGGAQPLELGLERARDLLLADHDGLRLLHPLHVALAIRTRPEAHLVDSARDRFLGARRQTEYVDVFAQQFGETDDGQVDAAARPERQAGKLGRRLGVDGAALGVQIADRGVGVHDLAAQGFEGFLTAPP